MMSPCYLAIAHAQYIEYSSLSTLAGMSYHICGKLEVAFKASPSSQHQHCTDEAQKAETVLSAVSYIYIYIYIYIKYDQRLYIYIKYDQRWFSSILI